MTFVPKLDWREDDDVTEDHINRWEQGIADAQSKEEFKDHLQSGAPHQYGGKFEWRYNPVTNSLDLVMLS
ncbi:hypothetical protein FZD47_25255 [Bacillus infantis]|uniref:Uncharacterized protein n=1 Tax=Bacillus infantis TaxID=324767 RepID=A0A5D4S0W0_9BACI|nr:hypothetical protein [Bacillus infantis]TYS55738.1 hypothetical protein FZD47_25255 [Bacillus infantis]